MIDMTDCKTENPKVIEIKKLIREHENYLILSVDKSPDTINLTKSEYFNKVNDFLGPNASISEF